jgi:hypothetical protein
MSGELGREADEKPPELEACTGRSKSPLEAD